jgi:hypothetical protein
MAGKSESNAGKKPGHDAWVVGDEPNVWIERADAFKREG